jgi:hypothetical protein
MSLPWLFNTTLDTIPQNVPYLFTDDGLVAYWQRELSYINAFKIGINWQGNPKYRGDRHRSIPLARFAPIAEVPNVRLISLQKGFGSEQIRNVRFSVTTLGDQVDDAAGAFMDTAAIMKNLDLFITSDTAMAHLAGALGIRVWMAIPYAADWRWLLDRDDCPWYPQMRLYRQKKLGDWEPVFARIKADLEQEVNSFVWEKPVSIQVSWGELLDRIAATECQLRREANSDQQQRFQAKLTQLMAQLDQNRNLPSDLDTLKAELTSLTDKLWDLDRAVEERLETESSENGTVKLMRLRLDLSRERERLRNSIEQRAHFPRMLSHDRATP